MRNRQNKSMAISGRPVAIADKAPRLFLVVDSGLDAGNSADQVKALQDILHAQEWMCDCENMLAAQSLRAWCRRLCRQLPDITAVHVILNATSLYDLRVVLLLVLSRFFGKQVTVDVSGPMADLDGDRLRSRSFILRLIDRPVVQSPYLHEQLQRRGLDVTLAPPVLDQSWFTDRVINRVQPSILWIGSRDEQSNGRAAIRAYGLVKQKYPRAELTMIYPEAVANNETVVTDSNGNEVSGVRVMTGAQVQSWPDLYNEADVFINTSVVDSFPIPLIRALATGLPVVSTDVGAIHHVMEHGKSGLLVPLDNPTAIADHIIDLVESDDLASMLSKNAPEAVRPFHAARAVRPWRRFMQGTFGAHP